MGFQGFCIWKFPNHIHFSFKDFILQYTLSVLVLVWNHMSITNAENRSYFDNSFDSMNLIWAPLTEQRSTGWSFLFNTKGKEKSLSSFKRHPTGVGWGNVGASSMLETQSLNNFFKPTLRCISTPKSHPLLIMSLDYRWAVSNHNCWIFSDYKTV